MFGCPGFSQDLKGEHMVGRGGQEFGKAFGK